MFIKKILEYSYNYAEYLVSDGKNNLICVCSSVPFPNEKEPKIGMPINSIIAFNYNDINIFKLSKEKDKKFLIKKLFKKPLSYKIRGKVLNCENFIIEVYGFKISLENELTNGLDKNIKTGDFIEFIVDRLDCTVDF